MGCNAHPTHPQGIGMHGDGLIDRPTSKHLGKRIGFAQLPEEVRAFVAAEYRSIWNNPPRGTLTRSRKVGDL